MPLEDETTLGQCGVEALSTQQVASHMLRGEVHGPWLMLGQNPSGQTGEKEDGLGQEVYAV